MANVFDVVAYITQQAGAVDRLKLQKLVYYAQGWSLAWDGAPLFRERIEAWRAGPVVRDLWAAQNHDHPRTGDPARLTEPERATLDEVLRFYGARDGAWLSELSHREDPWIEARGALPSGAASQNPVTLESLQKYFAPQAAVMGTRRLTDALARGLDLIMSLPEDEQPPLFAMSSVSGDEEIAFLEGRGPDPWASAS